MKRIFFLISCLGLNTWAMQQNNKESILQRIQALRLEYVSRSQFAGIAQHSVPVPGQPIVYWQIALFDVEHDDSKNINALGLNIASREDCTELFEILVDAGIDLNYKETAGRNRSMLGQACLVRANADEPEPELKNAKLLLQRGAQPKLPYKFNSNKPESYPAIKLLLEKGAKLEDIWEKLESWSCGGGGLP